MFRFLFFISSLFLQDLRTEHLDSPLGIDVEAPRFTWKVKGGEQTHFQIWVSTDSLKWSYTSGKKQEGFPLFAYDGPQLKPRTKYYWKVQVWTKEGLTAVSSAAQFETGIMKEWKGHWISDSRDIDLKPAPYFRHKFTVKKPIKQARAYIAVGGLYELSLNGQRIGDHFLDPLYTRFDRRVLYVTHDVTSALQRGENAIGVLLGNGWYNHQSTAVWYFDKAPWRNRPTFCLDLYIQYTDGTEERVSSGRNWKTALSPTIFNSIYTAEHYDARLEISGWDSADFDDKDWKNAIPRSAPAGKIVSQSVRPIRKTLEIKPVRIIQLNDSIRVVDFGRNISGVTGIKVKGAEGTEVRLRHAERLYENGRTDISNIDAHYRPTDDTDPFQTDIFILSGKGEEYFCPKFNYKGFQYVEIQCKEPIKILDIKAYFVHSDVPVKGKVNSSDELLNKIWQATNASYLSNFVGYPTDCPQREKNGWTGDAHIASETGLFNFDGITVYEKWLADHRDEQQANGVLPSIIPTGGWGYEWGNGPDWTSTIAIIPWNLYMYYGDKRPLEENYDALKRYVGYLLENYPSGLTDWGLGDWIPVKSRSPVELTSTAYYYTDVLILSKMAGVLGNKEDEKFYADKADYIKNTFNQKYFIPEKAIYGSGLQTELAVPLYWGLVPKEYKQQVADNLAIRVKSDGLDVGLLGTKAILQALSDGGHGEVAYALASRKTYPSWGWWIMNGATTLFENWPIDAKSDISMNHIMFGEIGAWYYKALGGIRPESAGFQKILVKPFIPRELERFSVELESPLGKIVSGWEGRNYTLEIPDGVEAELHVPKEFVGGSKVLKLKAGRHTFKVEP
ncbi:alpha-L-rhamnosidase [Leadbetterella byssophila DSM 17132]|uniref:alpha-L-rhamnosidase n=2 Tax=Leadbetterella TaxID=319458 RepID=E4RQ87_LEAB4|nr:alpha-L-rhamnosidase [Leadbetterella byssophila]ADQ17462.1 alpha-L-rhamnosidase [Leadbetterella byssophila DSM 17132]